MLLRLNLPVEMPGFRAQRPMLLVPVGLTLRSPTGMIADMIAGEWLTTRWMVMGHEFFGIIINYTLINFDDPSTGILADDM